MTPFERLLVVHLVSPSSRPNRCILPPSFWFYVPVAKNCGAPHCM